MGILWVLVTPVKQYFLAQSRSSFIYLEYFLNLSFLLGLCYLARPVAHPNSKTSSRFEKMHHSETALKKSTMTKATWRYSAGTKEQLQQCERHIKYLRIGFSRWSGLAIDVCHLSESVYFVVEDVGVDGPLGCTSPCTSHPLVHANVAFIFSCGACCVY